MEKEAPADLCEGLQLCNLLPRHLSERLLQQRCIERVGSRKAPVLLSRVGHRRIGVHQGRCAHHMCAAALPGLLQPINF